MPRLVTTAELDPRWTSTAVSVQARLEFELDNGSRVVLLDDRGWGTSRPASRWPGTPLSEVEDTARMVVGPDEPFGGWTQEQAADAHWATMSRIAASRGVTITASELRELRHDVVVGSELSALLDGGGA